MSHPTPMREVLRVFVSSPGDLQPERDLLEGVVTRLNRGVAGDCGFTLELVRWETHASSMLGALPQDAIDAQLGTYDIYLGMLWNRFGTPTGKPGVGSGTEAELLAALQRWRATQGR